MGERERERERERRIRVVVDDESEFGREEFARERERERKRTRTGREMIINISCERSTASSCQRWLIGIWERGGREQERQRE